MASSREEGDDLMESAKPTRLATRVNIDVHLFFIAKHFALFTVSVMKPQVVSHGCR